MNDYQDWRLTLRLLEPLGTPMHSDTLFGHLCWQIVLNDGEPALREFWNRFATGTRRLCCRTRSRSVCYRVPCSRGRVHDGFDHPSLATGERWDKAPFVAVVSFLALVRGDGNRGTLRQPVADGQGAPCSDQPLVETTGGDDERAGRFFETELWTLAGDPRVHVYLRGVPASKDSVVGLLEEVARVGFGRDKSVGCGAFAVENIEPWTAFGVFDDADGFVSLSTYVPSAADPTEGRWRLRIKRGRLGEHAGVANPFKHPLIEFEPGAVFRPEPDGSRSFVAGSCRISCRGCPLPFNAATL